MGLRGRVECRLVETDSVDLPEAPEPTIEEEKPDGLMLRPESDISWQGEHIHLLEGWIGDNRTIELYFLYNGPTEDMEHITFTYLTGEGERVGNVVTGVSSAGDGWCVRIDALDGTGWPNVMVIEALLNGTVLERFECHIMQFSVRGASSVFAARACMPIPVPVDPAHVFITSNSDHYHTRPGCSELANPRIAAQDTADNMGKTPCPLCCIIE